jgi:glycine/D-amino acid oxidase-like deaminating enzyme
MLQMVEMRYKGIQKILRVLGSDAIGFEACGGYECFETWPKNYEEQIAHLNSLLQPIMQRENAFSLVHHQLESFGMQGFGGMVANPMEGALHSGLYVGALSQLVAGMGVDIFYGTTVQNWQAKSNSIEVETSNHLFETAQIIFTSNAYLSQQMPQLLIAPARGQVLVTHPIPGLKMQGTFHFDKGFYYWRHVGGNRILLGGARNHDIAAEATTALETSDIIQQQLEAFLIRHLPEHFSAHNIQDKVDMRWSGLMAMSQSKLPVLEQVSPRVWALMCCNGMGVALSPVIAAHLATQVLTNP